MGVALRFRHSGWRVTFLGARTPPEHLARVCRAVEPDLIALSSVGIASEDEFSQTLSEYMAALPPKTKLVVGGAAGLKFSGVAKRLGATGVESASDWEELLG